MKKLDLKKDMKKLYAPSAKEVELVRVPKLSFAMIDGKGRPNNSKEFQNAIQALYSVSYTVKFKFKFGKNIEYPVMALEGLWLMNNGQPFDKTRRSEWNWTLMIMQPKLITKALLTHAIKDVNDKKGIDSLDSIRLEQFAEGVAIQIMHLGPYSAEAETIQKLDSFAKERGLEMSGKHHEIYLSDPRRVKPERMKTILRHPVKRAMELS
jgi:hypothetical protein